MKKTENLNKQIENMSIKLGQLKVNQNQCNLNFHGIEKTFSDYKSWSENRKTLIRSRIKKVEDGTNTLNIFQNHPILRNSVPSLRREMIKDCILPD